MRNYSNSNRIAHKGRVFRGSVAPVGRLINASDHDVNQYQIKRLLQAARIVADAVKEVSSRFSRRIPRSVAVKTNERGIYIEAGGPYAPNAFPFDPPNFPPPVMHPLFGNYSHRYPQPYRPFLEEGADISIDQATRAFSMIIDDWFRQSGLSRF